MQIYVCVKHVPDSAANIRILDQNRIDDSVAFLLNPYDEHAVTEAVSIKAKFPESEIIAVSLGPSDAKDTLRSAMAMGADRGILIESNTPGDSKMTAHALAAAIRRDGKADMILTGKESIDSVGMQTQFRIGAILDIPVMTNVSKIRINKGTVLTECELTGGHIRKFKCLLPCVMAAGRGLNTPGYPTLPDIMKSRKKPLETIALDSLGIDPPKASAQTIRLSELTNDRSPRPISGSPKQIADQIIHIIKKEAGLT